MTWFNLVDSASGKLISTSSVSIVAGNGQEIVETAERDGIWNETTKSYDAIPAQRIISLGDFIARFTDQEQEDFIEATKTIKKANTFLNVIKLIGYADLNSDFVTTSLDQMESAGIIGAGRAVAIYG